MTKIYLIEKFFILFDEIIAEKLKIVLFSLIEVVVLRVTHLGRKMNGVGSQHGSNDSGRNSLLTSISEKNHQLFDAEFFSLSFFGQKAIGDIIFSRDK